MTIHEALQALAQTLTRNFSVADLNPAQAEDQLKGPVAELLTSVGEVAGRDVIARTEAHTGLAVRPDLGVTADGLLVGHVELKAPGKGVEPSARWDRHDKEQFRRLADLPNLLYTDGNEWALYRQGTLVGVVAKAEGDVREDGTAAYREGSSLVVETILRDFLDWHPIVPSSPQQLAELLAPLARLLRESVRSALAVEASSLAQLASEWRAIFFPDADDAQFADAYAQTVTYALLLARVEGEQDLRDHAADRLDARHDLLAQVLRVLAQPAARAEVRVPIELLERVIEVVDPAVLARQARGRDVWLYFYEDFLAAYDPKLRKQSGVYYTPAEVVEVQVNLVSELLREHFDLELGFAEAGVVVLDPAVGTGTYLLAALEHGAETAELAFGPAARSERVSTMARNLHGFELLVGPYAVAQLRIAQRVLAHGGEIPESGLPILLTDTLESPFSAPPHLAHAPLFERRLAQENARARKVKADTSIIVCLGNPPYFRQVIAEEDEGVERQGGWVRYGDEETEETRGILMDFLRGVPGLHAKNLYNLYVYFWRWALWKVFETGQRHGIVSFITASSYLRGPGFAGMRRHMRELFEELWIIDLGGEGRGARRSENVFAIQTPVAIAIGYRTPETDSDRPARVRYARVEGTRADKLRRLAEIHTVDDIEWRECFEEWTQPLLPRSEGDFFSWPALTDIFPWQHSGVQFKRTWPIAPEPSMLERRWTALVQADPPRRPRLFRETAARTAEQAIRAVGAGSPIVHRYAYRSLDRQFCLGDACFADRPRPDLRRTYSSRQLFLTSLVTGLLGEGPAAVVTHLLPDLDHFRGSYGGKHVMPLWRDAECTRPNVTAGLLERLECTAENLLGYCYCILQAPSYTERFFEELEIPGPRIPITVETDLFDRAVALGRELIWLHTYCERFVPDGHRAGRVPQGEARYVKAIPQRTDAYPETHAYDEETMELHVGEGVFAPVSPQVRSFSISGLDVIGSWLDYRMKAGAGRQSSELDRIRPEIWPEQFTAELLELLWVLERTVALEPALDELLDAIVAGPTIPAIELPAPTEAQRKPPP